MKTQCPHEVIVVGAGPVGMLAALKLSKNGIATKIIDQQPCPASRSYACALHPRALKILDSLNLAREVIQNGRIIHSIGVFHEGERWHQIKLSSLPIAFPFLVVLEQSVLEDLLHDELRRTYGVSINWNHRLGQIEQEGAAAKLTIEKLTQVGHGYSVPDFEWAVEKEITEYAPYVIGADGQHSRVRRCLGMQSYSSVAPEPFIVFKTQIQGNPGHDVNISFDDHLTSVMWPLSAGDCRWTFQMPGAIAIEDFPEKDRERVELIDAAAEHENVKYLRALLSRRAPWFHHEVLGVQWNTRVQFEHRLAERFGSGRCWLAGDAAHQTSPIGVQSMNVGLAEASDLAESITQILRYGAPQDLLADYDSERLEEWNRMLGLSNALQSNGKANPWVIDHWPAILASLPGSGYELDMFLGLLGLQFSGERSAVTWAI